jgi:hypothetical protein
MWEKLVERGNICGAGEVKLLPVLRRGKPRDTSKLRANKQRKQARYKETHEKRKDGGKGTAVSKAVKYRMKVIFCKKIKILRYFKIKQ